jgi:hypothetical protein
MPWRAVAAAAGVAGDGEPQERHRADVPGDIALELVFCRCPLGAPVAAGPGFQEPAGLAVSPDERGADVPAEDRCAVVAAAGIPAGGPAAVLAQPAPQGALAGGSERVGADAHDFAGASGAGFAVFEDEVDAVARPAVAAGAIRQPAGAPFAAGQLVQQPVELIQVRLAGRVHDSCSMVVPDG